MLKSFHTDNTTVNPLPTSIEIRTEEEFHRADEASIALYQREQQILAEMQALFNAGNQLRAEIRAARTQLDEAMHRFIEERFPTCCPACEAEAS